MSDHEHSLAQAAAELRRRFDESFAAPVQASANEYENFLAIRVGPDPYAIRLDDVVGLRADAKVVSLPASGGASAAFLGIISVRGALAPAYDLRVLLGYPGGSRPRWMVLVRAPSLVGLAFDLFEAHGRIPRRALPEADAARDDRQYIGGVVSLGGVDRSMIHLASVLKAIEQWDSVRNSAKER